MKSTLVILTLFTVVLLAGCGPSTAERDAQERQRMELEEKARRETEAANKAISENNKKLGRKPPSFDLGVPSEPKTPATEPTPEPPKEP